MRKERKNAKLTFSSLAKSDLISVKCFVKNSPASETKSQYAPTVISINSIPCFNMMSFLKRTLFN